MTRRGTRLPLGDGTEPWHGRASGYNYHNCGCARCREWMRRTKRDQALPVAQRRSTKPWTAV